MGIESKVIVFTGKISKPRQEFQRLVVENGGKFGTSVTKNTDYLVLGQDPGSKLAVATRLGTKIISEQEFMELVREERTDEAPLSKEELAELETHMTTRTCKWCGSTYKQFDTVPDYETCPVCEILSHPTCPKCGSEPVFVTMSNNYYCGKCYAFFDAPHSDAVEYTEHIHILNDDMRCVVCRESWPGPAKVYPGKVLSNLRELRSEQARRENTQREAEWEREKQYQRWLQSLSGEQINELKVRHGQG